MLKMLRHVPDWVSALFNRCPDYTGGRDLREFLVIGHRGYPCEEVENTIPSFEAAMDKGGANALELDLCMTADGEIILWHDWNPDDPVCHLRRAGLEPEVKYCPCYPGEERPVSGWSYNEFIRNHGYQAKGSEHSHEGARIPTLDEFMSWASGKERLRTIFFDIKIPDEEAAIAPKMLDAIESVLRRYPNDFTIILEIPHLKVLKEMKRYRPHRNYALDVQPDHGIVLRPSKFSGVRPAFQYDNAFATIQRPRPTMLAPWTTHKRVVRHDLALRERRRRRNAAGGDVKIICFTINDPEEMRCLINMGVDGIQTDKVDVLRKVVGII